jgi:nucleoside-diphosphate-sugar epimerase
MGRSERGGVAVMTLRILVTGAAGGLGIPLVTRLRQRGHAVRALVLPGDLQRARLLQLGCEVWPGDVCDPATLAGVCREIDVVCHLAAVVVSNDPAVFGKVNRDGTRNLLACADAEQVRHFVYVSSASVTYPRRTPYADAKWQAEHAVARRRGGYSIARPTLVYDEHGGHELQLFSRYLRRYPVVPFIGAGQALKRPVWSEDVVSGLTALCELAQGSGKIYNLSGAEPIRMLELARLLLHYHAAERPIVPVPVPLCRLLAHVMGRVMAAPPLTASAITGVTEDANLDPGEATRDLGYRPIGVREGFERCYGPKSKGFK